MSEWIRIGRDRQESSASEDRVTDSWAVVIKTNLMYSHVLKHLLGIHVRRVDYWVPGFQWGTPSIVSILTTYSIVFNFECHYTDAPYNSWAALDTSLPGLGIIL
jgi:hypothetical protein